MVNFTTSTATNNRIDMSDPLLVDFNRFDESGEGGQGATNFSWFTSAGDPAYSEVDVSGTNFNYGFSGNLVTGVISTIAIDRGDNNGGGADIVIVDTGALTASAIDRTDPRRFWNEVLKGNDTFDLSGLSELNVGFGLNVIFGDDFSSATVNGAPASPTDQGGNDTIVGGDNRFDLIGDVLDVAGFTDGVSIFRAFYQAGDDNLSGASSTFTQLIGDAYEVGTLATLNGGDDVIEHTDSNNMFAAGDVLDQLGGVVNGGSDTLGLGGGSAAGDVLRFYGGTLNAGGDVVTARKSSSLAGDVHTVLGSGTIVGGGDAIGGSFFSDIIAGDVFDRGSSSLTLIGGNDAIRGASGNDTIHGELFSGALAGVTGGNDDIGGEDGNDRLFGQTGDDTLNGGAGDDLLDGDRGRDTATYVLSSSVSVSLSLTGQFTGSAGTDTIVGVENLIGSNFNDFLEDSGKANRIDGGFGDDIVRAGAGKDTLIGGDGLDLLDYSGSAAAIRVDLGAGTASGNDIGKDTLSGFERVRGGQASDTLKGSAGADELTDRNGNDRLDGGAGNDTLRGGTGEDRLLGSGGRDGLLGEDGGDRLDGGAGNDALDGGIGADTLIGGGGKDQLAGGAGRDTYAFGRGSGVDIVVDFVDFGGAEDDRIDVRAYDFANVRAIGKVASGDNLVLNLGGGNSVTLLQYLATHTLNQINDDILV